MKNLIKAFDDLPLIVKVILCIPMLDIVWSIYKIARSADKSNLLGIILGILTIIPGAFFIWIIDLVTVLLNNKVWWLD
ncbi:MAG: hypothetical protein K2M08_05140 [Anaeroplasmataceae bacterium]|nr:hypothetical protein [Anaeroplasma bactoclasticum]MCM1196546.1 hypothetical protein [Roseburia sp.]MCM1557630.1 hypothetical protein [Anaeroplasma bactoclasticum]MDE6241792.1 hypothetical protein [Anaeroplasmataceae bacterium]